MLNKLKLKRGMRLSGHLTLMGQTKNIYKIFVKKHEGKIPLERSQYRKNYYNRL